ncbi:MAG: S49 family peptidase [Vicinamibacterales bacterium]
MSRVLEYIDRTPWAITPEGLSVVRAIAAREEVRAHDILAIGKEPGQPLNGNPAVQIRGSVAVVPLAGPLFRYANLFTRFSGATSLEVFSNDLGEALRDPKVRAIILDVNSPGGEVNGTEETAKLIRAARGQKPIYALISGVGASAAYWIASAAEKVFSVETGLVGNIGTVLTVDVSAPKDTQLVFISSQTPRKRLDPADAGEAALIQEMVDALAQVFIENVADNRGTTVEKVLSDFGQGHVLVGAAAHAAGMVDGIATLESLVTELSGRAPAFGSRAAAVAGGGSTPNGGTMAEQETPAADAQRPTIDRAYLDTHHADLVSSIRTEGATAERTRVLGIQDLSGSAETRRACQNDQGCSVGDAALRLNRERADADARAAQSHLEGRAAAESEVEAPPPSSPAQASADQVVVHRILANARRLPKPAQA